MTKETLSNERESIDLIKQRLDVEWVYPEENVRKFIKEVEIIIIKRESRRLQLLELKKLAGDKLL